MSTLLSLQSAASSRARKLLVAGISTLALTCAVFFSSPASSVQNQANATMILVTRPTSLNNCTGCHGSDLKGRKGFSPGLTKSGVLKVYTKKQFETVMNTGKTPRGTMVMQPMRAYGYPKSVSDAMYVYLHTQP